MPELPEVEITKNDLKKKIIGATILKAETDWPKIIKEPSYEKFAQEIKRLKILDISRRAKNIVITLSQEKTLIIHLKLTGHLLVVSNKVSLTSGRWQVEDLQDPLRDPQNQFIHLVLGLNSNQVLALSDLRKFANVKLVDTKKLGEILAEFGPEPLDPDFSFEKFKEALSSRKGPIKKVLMDQAIIAGIGNIYGDEILFEAKIHPERTVPGLKKEELKRIYQSTLKILNQAIELRGTSTSDFRDTNGKKGAYGDIRKVYRKTGEPCRACQTPIKRLVLGGRSSHFCPACQRLKP